MMLRSDFDILSGSGLLIFLDKVEDICNNIEKVSMLQYNSKQHRDAASVSYTKNQPFGVTSMVTLRGFLFYAGVAMMLRSLQESDKQAILHYLKRNEIETSFLYANIVTFGVENQKDQRRCADYYGFFEDHTLKGILPFYNLGSCIPHFETDAAIPVFGQLMKERDFKRLMGMDRVIRPLYKQIRDFKKVEEYSESSYFSIDHLQSFTVDDLVFVDAKETDEAAVDFIVNARSEGFNDIVTKDDVVKALKYRTEEEDFIIAVKNGKRVAQACVQTYTDRVNQIGGVFTLNEERGKGYCKAVVAELCKRIISRNKIPTLFVVKDNASAVRAYRALGFQYYADYLLVKFE